MTNAHLGMAIGAALLLAGCGGDGAGNGATAASTATESGGMPSDWKATDACSIVDKAAIESVLGTTVTESALSAVHEPTPGAGDAGMSECGYILADGRATVLTRWSPIADNSKEAIDLARNTMNATLKGFGGGTVEDVAGVGKTSLWVEKMGQLQSFIGEDRMVLITVPSGAGAKDKAIALAKKAGA
jgi:hypothetical protein